MAHTHIRIIITDIAFMRFHTQLRSLGAEEQETAREDRHGGRQELRQLQEADEGVEQVRDVEGGARDTSTVRRQEREEGEEARKGEERAALCRRTQEETPEQRKEQGQANVEEGACEVLQEEREQEIDGSCSVATASAAICHF